MNIASKLLMASALALAVATPALAQNPEGQTLLERNIYAFMNGKMVHMKASDTTHAMIMKEFKALPSGTLIYVSGGKLYMAEDKKMASGKMLSAEIFGRDPATTTQ